MLLIKKTLQTMRASVLAGVSAVGLITATNALAENESVLAIEHWQTKNGADVYFYPTENLPMVDVRVSFDAGSVRDPETQQGTAALTRALLTEGSGEKTAAQMAQGFAELGAQLNTNIALENVTLRLRSLSQPQYLEPAVDLFNQTLTKPAFKEDTFARELRRQKQSVVARGQSPRALATDGLREAMFADHPYANLTAGDEQSLENISQADIQAFYEQYYVARNADVVIVGDLTRSAASELAEQVLEGLPMGESAPSLPKPVMPEAPQVKHIAFPSEQSTVYVAYAGVERLSPDYFPLYVGNHILGGSGFSSRLNAELRQKRGLAYSVGSFLMPLREGGIWAMSIQTRNDAVDEAIDLLRDEFAQFREDGPTQTELENSIANIRGGFPLRLDSNSKIVGQIGSLAFFGLPTDYFDRYLDDIQAVDQAAIMDAFQTHIDPSRYSIVVVGPQAPKTE